MRCTSDDVRVFFNHFFNHFWFNKKYKMHQRIPKCHKLLAVFLICPPCGQHMVIIQAAKNDLVKLLSVKKKIQ